ncbi:AGAP010344-PA-like protein [Anopheles sinensis]|uniref:AGAP010344-PA-like protein n=1 Tax=Anopheles sinensis TaxID=74873 RepID=A0A084VJX5_ANOSI|nr:AGAP010344-PA-like protein [Anopheles sinensis]
MRNSHGSNGVFNPGYSRDSGENADPGVRKPRPKLSQVIVTRPHYQQEDLNNAFNYFKPKSNFFQEALEGMRDVDTKSCITGLFPIFQWLPEYQFPTDLLGDIISGITVGVMHIPQGMGYALLANMPPITGIYTAFFPVFIYFLFGSSRHNSMGTLAVVSIMTGKVVYNHSGAGSNYTNLEVGTALCFMVGLIQLVMCLLRMGAASFLLSEALVSGFTTGAAVYVFTSQMKDILGVTLPPLGSRFEIVNTYYELGKRIPDTNLINLGIAAVSIIILLINNEIIKPRLAKLCIIPIPIQLILVVSGTLLSIQYNLKDSLKVVGTIPQGLPAPQMPNVNLFSEIFVESITVAVVGYTISVSLGIIFAKKENYEIGFNQELLALGAGNLFGSFFSCFPFAASLSRAAIQYLAGGKTQITGLVSCSLLAVVLLFVASFFEPLPRCILASIIAVSVQGLLMQVKDLPQFWRQGFFDGVTWVLTFVSVVFISIDVGLVVGFALSVSTIFFRALKPYMCKMGNVPNSDVYLDITRYEGLIEFRGIKIIHYSGGLHFASRATFKNTICQFLDINLTEEIKRHKASEFVEADDAVKFLVLDFTALSYIDPSAISTFKSFIKELESINIQTLLAGCSPLVFEKMKKCNFIGGEENYVRTYPTIHDAVHFAQKQLRLRTGGAVETIQEVRL